MRRAVTRYGVLIETSTASGNYVVAGPWHSKTQAEDVAADENSLPFEIGNVIAAVEIINWEELYRRAMEEVAKRNGLECVQITTPDDAPHFHHDTDS